MMNGRTGLSTFQCLSTQVGYNIPSCRLVWIMRFIHTVGKIQGRILESDRIGKCAVKKISSDGLKGFIGYEYPTYDYWLNMEFMEELMELNTWVGITDIFSNLGIGGGVLVWAYRKFHEKRDQDIHYLIKEITNMAQFSEQCKDALNEARNNNLTIADWINETRRYASHTGYNNFITIQRQLNEPDNEKVKELLKFGNQIRNALQKGRDELKQHSNQLVDEKHQNIFTKQAKVVETVFSELTHKESTLSNKSQDNLHGN